MKMFGKTMLFGATALALMIGAGAHAAPADDATWLSGTIRDAKGSLSGATVSARKAGTTITTSVFTDAKGAYYFPNLTSGRYVVWAQAEGYRLANDETSLTGHAHQNFTLNPIADVTPQMTGDEYLASLPETTPEDKLTKRIFQNNCTGCHTPSYILNNKFDEAGWKAIANTMKTFGHGAPFAIIDHYKDRIAAYLARARGPGKSSMTIRLRPRPSGDSARAVFREYEVPIDPSNRPDTKYVTNDGSNWEMGSPSFYHGGVGVHDIEFDLAGNLYFASNMPSQFLTIGRVDAKTGQVKYFRVDGANDYAAASHGIVRDSRGVLWFNATLSRAVSWMGRIDPATQELSVVKQPPGILPVGGSIDIDGKGKIWASVTRGGVLYFDPKTAKFVSYRSPTFNTPMGPGLTYGTMGDRDGNGWWIQMEYDTVNKVDIKTGKISSIKLQPLPGWDELLSPEDRKFLATAPYDWNGGPPWIQGPRRGDTDLEANIVWVCNWWSGSLTRIDVRTNKVTYIPLPHPETQQPYQAKVDSHHNVWVAMMNTDQVLKYDPSTGKWSSYDLPTHGAEIRYLSLLERDGKMEIALPYYRARKVAILSFRSDADMDALAKDDQSGKK